MGTVDFKSGQLTYAFEFLVFHLADILIFRKGCHDTIS